MDLQNFDYKIKEQDRYLPIANVTRTMKKALSPNAKLSKEARECVQECALEFISFVTSQAMDKCLLEKRKTLNGEDILYALHSLGFEHYLELLKIYLVKYRHLERHAPPKKRTKNYESEDELVEPCEFLSPPFDDLLNLEP